MSANRHTQGGLDEKTVDRYGCRRRVRHQRCSGRAGQSVTCQYASGRRRLASGHSAQTKSNTVTISGCIQDVPMTTAGAAATPSVAGATKNYYLNNAMMAADAGRDRPAVGTAGLTASGYRLEGDTALITPHLNHQVRITGTVQSSNASPTGAANAAPGSTAAGPTLKVESVTMVSAKCEAPKA
jgi:hypothetical protein